MYVCFEVSSCKYFRGPTKGRMSRFSGHELGYRTHRPKEVLVMDPFVQDAGQMLFTARAFSLENCETNTIKSPVRIYLSTSPKTHMRNKSGRYSELTVKPC